jgi:hypothetical protein
MVSFALGGNSVRPRKEPVPEKSPLYLRHPWALAPGRKGTAVAEGEQLKLLQQIRRHRSYRHRIYPKFSPRNASTP